MTNAEVSVIIPSNREGPYLIEAIASVRAQTVPVHEIILVDDGCPSPGLADVASECDVRYIRQAPSGISIARNTGVEAAHGEWIAFLDDDDVWHPERIAFQLQALARVPHAIASHTGGWYMDRTGAPLGAQWAAVAASSEDMITYRVPPPRVTTLLVTRSAYRRVGGCSADLEPAEDNDLILRLLQRGEFVAVDRALVGYRRHEANVTTHGLAGRKASRLSTRRAYSIAKKHGDHAQSLLLGERMKRDRRISAAENLGELITAVRSHDWQYARDLAAWGVRTVPGQSAGAIWRRVMARAWRRKP